MHFHFFSAHFPGNSSKQIRCSGCRKFRRVATAVGNFRRLATAAGNFAMLLRLSGIYKSFAENADLKLYPVDFPDFSGNLPMGSPRKSEKYRKSSGPHLHPRISSKSCWYFATFQSRRVTFDVFVHDLCRFFPRPWSAGARHGSVFIFFLA